MGYIHTLHDGPDFLCTTSLVSRSIGRSSNADSALDATTDVAIWSTVEPGIGITAGSLATLRPLVRHCLWLTGLAEAPREGRSSTYYPSNSERKRKDRRGYRRSLSPSDLVPTEVGGTTSTQIRGPHDRGYFDTEYPPKIVVTDTDSPWTPDGHIMQTMTLEQEFEQEYDVPPRLHLRDSFRYSFTRGSILSLGKFRIPD
jgi:hypothetical protein